MTNAYRDCLRCGILQENLAAARSTLAEVTAEMLAKSAEVRSLKRTDWMKRLVIAMFGAMGIIGGGAIYGSCRGYMARPVECRDGAVIMSMFLLNLKLAELHAKRSP